ncbi:MFS transporter [Egicoccus halophilus]|uniref:MFS transporter n=1 Tax=Egicoccus halophilus TaxID=1670830 RepID=UPI001E53238B|nr:MFS transporter [Egicoccus halophilus]
MTTDPTRLTPTSPAPQQAPVTTFAPLQVPEYRRIWIAALVSHLGTFLQLTAAPWVMQEMTNSPLLVALVTTSLTMPRLLLTLPAGALADIVDRRTLMLIGQFTSALAVAAMAVMTATGILTPYWLLGLTFVLGVGNAIGLPSFQTLIPDLVPRRMMAQAITLNSGAFNVARAIGPAIGGIVVGAGFASSAFGANAASYLAIVGVLLTFPRAKVEDTRRQPLWRSTAAGVRYARFTRPIRVLLGVTATFALTTASIQSLLPVVSTELGLGGTGFGVLYGLFGAGALVGVLTRERARVRFAGRMLPGAVLTFGVSGVVFGVAPHPVLAGAALAVNGLCWVYTLVTMNATVQLLAPRWVRSRVVSLYVLAIGVQPVGAFAAGALAEWVGAGTSVAVFNVGTVLLGLLAFRLGLPVLGEFDEPAAPDDWHVPRHARHVAGSPVLVANTWEIDHDDAEEFLAVMRDLRRQRFRTGAHRWSLYRDADRPTRITEFFVVHDWEEHLAQHARMDQEVADVLARARAFDRAEGPVTRHLAGLDVLDSHAPPVDEQLLTIHADAHRADGSLPLDERS